MKVRMTGDERKWVRLGSIGDIWRKIIYDRVLKD